MPVWFAITMPELLLVIGLVGIFLAAFRFITAPQRYFLENGRRNFVLYFVCFLVPPVAMFAYHGANIDDWRHLYFIYPCFVLLSVLTLKPREAF